MALKRARAERVLVQEPSLVQDITLSGGKSGIVIGAPGPFLTVCVIQLPREGDPEQRKWLKEGAVATYGEAAPGSRLHWLGVLRPGGVRAAGLDGFWATVTSAKFTMSKTQGTVRTSTWRYLSPGWDRRLGTR